MSVRRTCARKRRQPLARNVSSAINERAAASGADAVTSFGVVDDLSVCHIWFC